jgi:hypothetical protein
MDRYTGREKNIMSHICLPFSAAKSGLFKGFMGKVMRALGGMPVKRKMDMQVCEDEEKEEMKKTNR